MSDFWLGLPSMQPGRDLSALEAAIFGRFEARSILIAQDLQDLDATANDLVSALDVMVEHRELDRAIEGMPIFCRAGLGLGLIDLKIIARQFARVRGWRSMPGRYEARCLLSSAEPLDSKVVLATDAVTEIEEYRALNGCIVVEPVPAWVFDVAKQPLDQLIVQAFRGDELDGLSEDSIRRHCERVAKRTDRTPDLSAEFSVAARRLPEPYAAVARLMSEATVARSLIVTAADSAPAGWEAPVDIDIHPQIEDWKIVLDKNQVECLYGAKVFGHPTVLDNDQVLTSPLAWFDEALGWARTTSRLFRLGRRARRL